MTTSPRASIPPVTDETLKSVSFASIPVACLIALQVASIIPSPSAVASDLCPSRADNDSRSRHPERAPLHVEHVEHEALLEAVPSSSATIASRSASVSCTLRSASSLKRANAAFRASPWTADAELFQRVGEGVTPGVLAEDDLAALWPTEAASMIS